VNQDKWYLIELNPLETSGAGHLFNISKELNLLKNGPFELRFHSCTPENVIQNDIHEIKWI